MPWPNRIRDGRYAFGDRDLQLGLTEPTRHNASHGLVRWAAWTPEEHTAALGLPDLPADGADRLPLDPGPAPALRPVRRRPDGHPHGDQPRRGAGAVRRGDAPLPHRRRADGRPAGRPRAPAAGGHPVPGRRPQAAHHRRAGGGHGVRLPGPPAAARHGPRPRLHRPRPRRARPRGGRAPGPGRRQRGGAVGGRRARLAPGLQRRRAAGRPDAALAGGGADDRARRRLQLRAGPAGPRPGRRRAATSARRPGGSGRCSAAHASSTARSSRSAWRARSPSEPWIPIAATVVPSSRSRVAHGAPRPRCDRDHGVPVEDPAPEPVHDHDALGLGGDP